MLGEKNIEKRKWLRIVFYTKAGRAQETSGRKKSEIQGKKQVLIDRLSQIRLPEIIKPKFEFSSQDIGTRNLIYIHNGSCSYKNPILQNINLSLFTGEKIALIGNN